MRTRRPLDRPIITANFHPTIEANIQGPSMIRVPDWIGNRLGEYYLYFADHKGSYIRLAYADHPVRPRVRRSRGGGMPRASTHIFRVRLWPKLYRDIEIDSNKSLYDLAAAIVRAFGFAFDHAFGFFSKLTGDIYGSPVRYELFADLDDDPLADGYHRSKAGSVKCTKVSRVFPEVGSKMLFLSDYGDHCPT